MEEEEKGEEDALDDEGEEGEWKMTGGGDCGGLLISSALVIKSNY